MDSGPAMAVSFFRICVLVMSLQSASALRCYQCNTETGPSCSRPSTCSNQVCFNATSASALASFTIRECLAVDMREMSGCITTPVEGVNVRMCYCATDFCNGPRTVPTVQPVTVDPRLAVTCYQCNSQTGNCDNPSTCVGASCTYATGSMGSLRMTILDCNRERGSTECQDITVGSIPLRFCQCNTNYCNRQSRAPSTPASNALAPVGGHTTPRPVTCYRCDSTERNCDNPSTCVGVSCTHGTGRRRGISVTFRGCLAVKTYSMDGCMDTVVSGVNVQVCFCGTDFCNGPPRPTVHPVTVNPWLAVTCYQCNSMSGNCDHPSTCVGASCLYATSNMGDLTYTVLDCHSERGRNECTDITVGTLPVRTCQCSTNYCNRPINGLVTSSPRPQPQPQHQPVLQPQQRESSSSASPCNVGGLLNVVVVMVIAGVLGSRLVE